MWTRAVAAGRTSTSTWYGNDGQQQNVSRVHPEICGRPRCTYPGYSSPDLHKSDCCKRKQRAATRSSPSQHVCIKGQCFTSLRHVRGGSTSSGSLLPSITTACLPDKFDLPCRDETGWHRPFPMDAFLSLRPTVAQLGARHKIVVTLLQHPRHIAACFRLPATGQHGARFTVKTKRTVS